MQYCLIEPPVSVPFCEMSKAQIAEYGRWFHAVLPERLEHLVDVVRDDPGFFDWSADLSPESLSPLGEWFETQVETRELTSSELREVLEAQPFPIEIDGCELTERTLSLVYKRGDVPRFRDDREHPRYAMGSTSEGNAPELGRLRAAGGRGFWWVQWCHGESCCARPRLGLEGRSRNRAGTKTPRRAL